MSQASGQNRWLSRLAFLGAGIVGTCSAVGAVYPIAKDSWLQTGREQKQEDVIESLRLVAAKAPPEQKDLINKLAESFARAVVRKNSNEAPEAAAERQANEWATIIKSVDPRTYMPSPGGEVSGGKMFEVQSGQTALICDGKHTATFNGLWRNVPGRYHLKVDGGDWASALGERRRFRGGFILTVIEISPAAARLLAACE